MVRSSMVSLISLSLCLLKPRPPCPGLFLLIGGDRANRCRQEISIHQKGQSPGAPRQEKRQIDGVVERQQSSRLM